MKSKRYTTEQKIRILRESERSDTTISDVCRAHQISEQTFHRWKREFGMLEVEAYEAKPAGLTARQPSRTHGRPGDASPPGRSHLSS